MRTSASGYAASIVVGIEGIGIAALVVWQILALVAGDTGSLASSIALVVLTAVGAVAVLAFAVAIWRDRSWGRSGGIVTQVLILAVALGAATGAYAEPTSAPAIVALVLLVFAVHAAGRVAKDEASV
jgi:hypothetical protein